MADTFPPQRTSGAVQLRDLVTEWQRQGHAVTVILPSPRQEKPWSLEDFKGAQVLRFRSPSTKGVGYIARTIGEFISPFVMRYRLRETPLSEARWDLVVWYSPSIFFAPLVRSLKASSQCPGYLIIRDIFPEWAVDMGLMRRGLVYYLFRWIARRQYRLANVIGVQSNGNLGYFDAWRGGPERSVEVLENWLGPRQDLPVTLRLNQSLLAGRRVLVYAGNMGVAQGLDVVLRLAERLKNDRTLGFLFVGRGSERERLRQSADALRLENVMFHDEIDPDAIPDLYAQCAVGLVSLDLRHRSHNIPGKFLTYMQSGLPVFAIVNPGNDLVPLIASAGVGRAVESDDLDSIERGLHELIRDISHDQSLSARCLTLFQERYTVDRAARQILAVLDA